MARKLFVGGLPYRTTGDELKDAFSKAGEVASASIVTDRETGRSRGFGFVEMANDCGRRISYFHVEWQGFRRSHAHRQRCSPESCLIFSLSISSKNPPSRADFCFTMSCMKELLHASRNTTALAAATCRGEGPVTRTKYWFQR